MGALFVGVVLVAPGDMQLLIQVLFTAAALGLLSSPPIVRGSWRLGVVADDDALHEWFQLGGHRRWPWAELTEVRRDDRGAVLCFGQRQVRLGAPLEDWAELACRAEQRLHGESPAPTAAQQARGAMSDHQVLDLLGHPPDGQIVCTTRFWAWADCAFVPAALLALGAAMSTVLLAPAVLLATGFVATCGPRNPRRVREVRAGIEGLSVRSSAGWRSLSWAGLREVGRRGLFRVVTSDEGDLWLPPGLRGGERLLNAIGGAIRARERGYLLPRLSAEVPDGALSAAECAVDEARGLSIAQ